MIKRTNVSMPIVNKYPISGRRNSICKSCGNFLVYNYSETVYVCSVCGKQFDPRDVLAEIKDQNKKRKPIVKSKVLPTKKQILKREWKEILDQFEEQEEKT